MATDPITTPCDATKRAWAKGHESACGCAACNRAEAAKRALWRAKHAGTLDGYTPFADAGGATVPTDPETHADLRLDLELKTAGDGTLEGYGSVFGNKDSHDDVVVAGAFTRSLQQRRPVMLWQHRSDQPVGVWSVAREDDRGLYLKGVVTTDSAAGRDAYALVMSGACTGLSIGFRTVKSRWDEASKTRQLIDLDLFEVSFVSFPSNDAARIWSAKSGLPPLPAPVAAPDTDLDDLLDHCLATIQAYAGTMTRHSAAQERTVAALHERFDAVIKGDGPPRKVNTRQPCPTERAKAHHLAALGRAYHVASLGW
jgi:HK97 family phage prohead protease